jgi:hypothetical protein
MARLKISNELAAETTKVIGTVNNKVADGDDIALGAKADAAATVGDATPFSVIALLKGIFTKLLGTVTVSLTGSTLQEQKTQADAVANVITFSANIVAIEIFHAEVTWQAFTVNGLTLTIPSGGYRTPVGGVAGATVTIPAGISCIVGRLT